MNSFVVAETLRLQLVSEGVTIVRLETEDDSA